jgi:hypothetical protein
MGNSAGQLTEIQPRALRACLINHRVISASPKARLLAVLRKIWLSR